jgi:hypothetical protein
MNQETSDFTNMLKDAFTNKLDKSSIKVLGKRNREVNQEKKQKWMHNSRGVPGSEQRQIYNDRSNELWRERITNEQSEIAKLRKAVDSAKHSYYRYRDKENKKEKDYINEQKFKLLFEQLSQELAALRKNLKEVNPPQKITKTRLPRTTDIAPQQTIILDPDGINLRNIMNGEQSYSDDELGEFAAIAANAAEDVSDEEFREAAAVAASNAGGKKTRKARKRRGSKRRGNKGNRT